MAAFFDASSSSDEDVPMADVSSSYEDDSDPDTTSDDEISNTDTSSSSSSDHNVPNFGEANRADLPIDSDESFDVEEVMAWRGNYTTNKREFLLKWRNYPLVMSSWEPEENCACPSPMKRFVENLSRRQKRRIKKQPKQLSGLQRNAKIVSITADKSKSISLVIRNGRAAPELLRDDCNFTLLIVFEDHKEEAEEISLTQLMRERPEAALDFIEKRLVEERALRDQQESGPSGRIKRHRGESDEGPSNDGAGHTARN